MGQGQPKYHVTDEGQVYRVNEDGSFTDLGNAEDKMSATARHFNNDGQSGPHNLKDLENKVLQKRMMELSREEARFVAERSGDIEVLTEIFDYSSTGDDNLDPDVFAVLMKRYMSEEDLAPLGFVFSAGVYDDSDKIRMTLASAKVEYDDVEYVLQQLSKDKNPAIRAAAVSNPFYKVKKGGCFGIFVLSLATASALSLLVKIWLHWW